MTVVFSVLDLARIGEGENAADAFTNSVALARHAEDLGCSRVWYAEHHNMATVASSAPAVLIAHVAAHTSRIVLGAGGVMLPNHSPLVVAEQYGMLATLHPGRIELGLGRAPGSDQVTLRAMRRDHSSADSFPEDVLELEGYLRGESRVAGVSAVPGAGTNVPLFILGSSLYGARLSALLGLPFAFASHFAPAALREAVALHRAEFTASRRLERPHVYAAVNVICADRRDDALAEFERTARDRVRFFVGRGLDLSEDDLDRLVASPQGRQVLDMMRHTVVGTPSEVAAGLEEFRSFADADELVLSLAAPTAEGRLRTLGLVVEASSVAA